MVSLDGRRKTGQRLTWRRLLLGMGAANVVILLVLGFASGDREALSYAGVSAAAVALLALRGGVAGIVMVGVLAVNTAAWMVPAAAVNVARREQLLDIMIPASLAVISVTGAIAAVASLSFRRDPDADGRAVRIVAQVAIAVFVLAAGAATATRPAAAILAGDTVIRMHSASFSPEQLELAAGTVTLGVENKDLFWHIFTIDELGVDVGLPTRAERPVTFQAEPGIYEFFCAVPGHRLLGMEGTLTVG